MPIDQNTDTALPEILFTSTDNPTADRRIQSLAMNCFLSAAGHSRIIVPTVYREDYLLPLKSLSNHGDAAPYVRAMVRIQAWTAAFDYTQPLSNLYKALQQSNAFQEDLRNYSLIFPS